MSPAGFVSKGLLSGALCCIALLAPAEAQVVADAPAVVGDEAAGEALYSGECRVCHAGLIAPTLRGVVGRPIASVEGFSGYSDGLKARSGDVWTEANLLAFLKSPTEFAPGSAMARSFPDEQARADVIAFLKTLPPPG